LAAQVAEAFFSPHDLWRCHMARIPKCSQLLSGCSTVFRGDTGKDALRKKFRRLMRDGVKGT
jgi:hypothetical protein